jgi:hypothetical protein
LAFIATRDAKLASTGDTAFVDMGIRDSRAKCHPRLLL